MNKNTVIAMILSTVVVVASIFVQSKFFPNSIDKSGAESKKTAEEMVAGENSAGQSETNLVVSDSNADVKDEKNYTITTKNAEIVLTNRGGDVISYKLLNHIDVDTKDGVQMVDNVSAANRACALAFGNAESPILNELFNVVQENEYTYLFTRNYSITNEDGSVSKFVLGKRYTFDPESYMFKMDVLVHGDKVENLAYTLRTSPQIGPHFNPMLNRYENRQFISYNGGKAKRQVIGNKQFKVYGKDYLWNGIGGKYFVELVIPEKSEKMDFTHYSTLIEVNDYANAQAILVRKAFSEDDVKDTYYMYFGPRDEKALRIFNVAEKNSWNLSGLRLNECLNSNGWLGWLETVLKWIMEIIN